AEDIHGRRFGRRGPARRGYKVGRRRAPRGGGRWGARHRRAPDRGREEARGGGVSRREKDCRRRYPRKRVTPRQPHPPGTPAFTRLADIPALSASSPAAFVQASSSDSTALSVSPSPRYSIPSVSSA